jgi:hypothetical protein
MGRAGAGAPAAMVAARSGSGSGSESESGKAEGAHLAADPFDSTRPLWPAAAYSAFFLNPAAAASSSALSVASQVKLFSERPK